MPGSRFFDTSVLLYLASADARKAQRSEELVRDGGTVSIQVLNEIASVARRKMRLNWDETQLLLASIRSFVTVLPLTAEFHEDGLRIAERYRLSVFDAMIVAGALAGDCDTLWSEDMQHDMSIDGRLRIRDPFR